MIDRRYLIEESPDAVRQEVIDLLERLKAERQGFSYEIRDLWTQASEAGHLTQGLAEHLKRRVADIEAASAPVDQVVDAEVVDDADPDAVWEDIVRAGGRLGMTLTQLQDDFAKQCGGLIPADANAQQLVSYLQVLQGAIEQVPA